MSNDSSNGGLSLIGVLGIVFVVLKLTGHIYWSWWYVTLPFWGGLALVLAGLTIYILFFLVKRFILRIPQKPKKKKRSAFQQRMNEMVEQQKEKESTRNNDF